MDWFYALVGHNDELLNWWQMSIRGVLLFGFAVLLIRVAGRRVFGKNTALDIIISVILGSNMSRALTGNAPLIPTMIVTALLVGLHAGLSHLACRSRRVSRLVKGREKKLVEDGKLLSGAMRAEGVAVGDIKEVMRLHGISPDIKQLQAAYLERNGDISLILR